MIEIDAIDKQFVNGNIDTAIEMLSLNCKTYPYTFAGNVAQYCGYLATYNRLDDIERLMKTLRSK